LSYVGVTIERHRVTVESGAVTLGLRESVTVALELSVTVALGRGVVWTRRPASPLDCAGRWCSPACRFRST